MIFPKRFYHHGRDAIAIGYMRYSYNNETMIEGKKKDILIRERIYRGEDYIPRMVEFSIQSVWRSSVNRIISSRALYSIVMCSRNLFFVSYSRGVV